MAGPVDRAVIVGAHYNRLVQGFRPLVGSLAARCFAEKLIDMDSASAASANTQPEEDKTRALLAAVLDKIRTDGDQFELLVRIMCEFAELVSLAEDLEAALKIEEESSTRSVIVIRPPLQRSASITSEASEITLGESLEASPTAARLDPDNVSLQGFEEVLSDNVYDVLVNESKPVSETLAPPNNGTRSVQSEVAFEPRFGSSSSKAFMYDVWKEPLDRELYESTPDADVTTNSHQEVRLSRGYTFRGRNLQEHTAADWQDVVHKLNTRPGLIVNKKDDQIVTLKKKFKTTGSEFEGLIKTEEGIRREEAQLKAKMTSEEEKQDEFEKLQSELQDLRKHLNETRNRLYDNQKELHKTLLELRESQVKSKEQFDRLLKFFQDKPVEYVQKVDISKGAPVCDARHVLKALLPIADKWKTIGTLLGVEPTQLDKIDHMLSQDDDKLREMTFVWVKLESASWESLIDAVEQLDQVKAANIKRDFVQPPVGDISDK